MYQLKLIYDPKQHNLTSAAIQTQTSHSVSKHKSTRNNQTMTMKAFSTQRKVKILMYKVLHCNPWIMGKTLRMYSQNEHI